MSRRAGGNRQRGLRVRTDQAEQKMRPWGQPQGALAWPGERGDSLKSQDLTKAQKGTRHGQGRPARPRGNFYWEQGRQITSLHIGESPNVLTPRGSWEAGWGNSEGKVWQLFLPGPFWHPSSILPPAMGISVVWASDCKEVGKLDLGQLLAGQPGLEAMENAWGTRPQT